MDADDVVASIAAAPLLTTCRTHSKGCSCCISHGRGIADVGYSSTNCGSSAGGSRASSTKSARPRQARKGHVIPQPPSPQLQCESAASSSSSAQSGWYGCLYVACQSPYSFEVELPAITALSRMLTGVWHRASVISLFFPCNWMSLLLLLLLACSCCSVRSFVLGWVWCLFPVDCAEQSRVGRAAYLEYHVFVA